MKKFATPELEVVTFAVEDVITASYTPGDDEGPGF
jgi:hypothetical protein